jgi:hypothetical protein
MLIREGKGGIDWWRYREKVLLPKLLPFSQKIKDTRNKVAIQQDGAPSHAYWFTQQTIAHSDLDQLLWPGNSPDLNAIEPL